MKKTIERFSNSHALSSSVQGDFFEEKATQGLCSRVWQLENRCSLGRKGKGPLMASGPEDSGQKSLV
jgi:hypothetical protein